MHFGVGFCITCRVQLLWVVGSPVPALQLLVKASRPELTRPPSLKRSKPGDYARIKMIARVESRRWYLSHRIISMLSAILCFVVVIVGGVMTSISNRNLFQYLAAFLPVSITPFEPRH